MKRTIFALLFAAAASLSSTTQAQTYGGAVLDHDIMMPFDFAQLSRTQTFGTSRSMAMGGAFTSLGGDLSSVGINPAGLGMFTQGVFSFTPMISSANSTTTSQPSWVGDNKTTFALANIGATFNITESAQGALISLTGAVTYNRLADYNSQMSFSSLSSYDSFTGDLVPSIVDVFIGQLAGASIYPSSDSSMEYADNPYYWPAQAAYKTYLLDPSSDNSSWGTNTIGDNASVVSSYSMSQRGRADEYSFAMGGNIANVLYFGATLGLQEINQTTEYVYQEEYLYEDGYAYSPASSTDPIDMQAEYSYLWQKTKLSGSGVNLKLGLTARPTRALRVGVAFHTPTYYSLARSYQTSMETIMLGNDDDIDPSTLYVSTSPEIIDSYEYSWDFRTPSKLLAGASLQVGNFGIVSVDYQREWYNWIRVTNAPGEITPYQYQLSFEEYYKPVNTLRVGVEVKPVPTVALRAGGGYSSSMIKDETQIYSSPVATGNNYITCGVGFALSPTTTFDLAYQFYHQDYTPYYLFYVEDGGSFTSSSDLFETSYNYNYFAATLTFRL